MGAGDIFKCSLVYNVGVVQCSSSVHVRQDNSDDFYDPAGVPQSIVNYLDTIQQSWADVQSGQVQHLGWIVQRVHPTQGFPNTVAAAKIGGGIKEALPATCCYRITFSRKEVAGFWHNAVFLAGVDRGTTVGGRIITGTADILQDQEDFYKAVVGPTGLNMMMVGEKYAPGAIQRVTVSHEVSRVAKRRLVQRAL